MFSIALLRNFVKKKDMETLIVLLGVFVITLLFIKLISKKIEIFYGDFIYKNSALDMVSLLKKFIAQRLFVGINY